MDLRKNHLSFGIKPALIIVDVMKGFTNTNCVLGAESDVVVESIYNMVESFREKSYPIVCTRVIYRDPSEASVFRALVPALEELKEGSEWNQIDRRININPKKDIIIEKKWASAFFDTNLNSILQEKKVDCLVVCGLSTSGCVRATAVDGLQYNYPVFVVEEACGDRNVHAHFANLFDINAKYGEVIALEKLLLLL